MDSLRKGIKVVRQHSEIQTLNFFFCIISWLCQTNQKLFGKSKLCTTGQNAWSNDYSYCIFHFTCYGPGTITCYKI